MNQINPLEKFYRQPKFNLLLPSRGRWYPKDSIQLNEDGSVPVFAMTAKDDLIFKNGEILLEKQATLELLKSCIPAIKIPDFIPSLDLDACLMAIRKATYGDNLELTVVVPKILTTKKINVSISKLLENIGSADNFDTELIITADDGTELEVKVKPIPLSALLNNTKSIIAQNGLTRTLDDEHLSDEDKIAKLNQAFKLIDAINVDMVLESIEYVKTNGQIINSAPAIKNLLQNCDAAFFNAIKSHVEAQKGAVGIKPIVMQSNPEEIQLGAPETYEVEVKFDNTEFFK